MATLTNDTDVSQDVRDYASAHVDQTGDTVVAALLNDLAERDATLEKMQAENHSTLAIRQYLEDSAGEIEVKHSNRVAKAVGELESRAAELEAQWAEDSVRRPEATLLRERRLEASIQAMGDDELETLADSYISGEADLSKYALDLLAGSLKRSGSEHHGALRKAMSDRRASEQWRRTPDGAQVGEALDHYRRMRGGQIAYTVDGAAQVYPLARLLHK